MHLIYSLSMENFDNTVYSCPSTSSDIKSMNDGAFDCLSSVGNDIMVTVNADFPLLIVCFEDNELFCFVRESSIVYSCPTPLKSTFFPSVSDMAFTNS